MELEFHHLTEWDFGMEWFMLQPNNGIKVFYIPFISFPLPQPNMP